ncbi:MAG: hypothetical protein GY851_09865, partial [bacterium]|nr:hypothetical protein [bacterium]
NDDRTYGTRFGEWKLRFELGVPQTAKASVAIDGRPALYDTLLRTRVEYEEQDGRAVFDVRLPAARGMLVAALPEAVGEVVVTVPAAAKVGDPVVVRVEVRGESGNVLPCTLPIEIDAIDPLGRETEWHRYTTAEDGVREYTFVPALNDALGEWRIRVTDLVAGLVGEASVAVAE